MIMSVNSLDVWWSLIRRLRIRSLQSLRLMQPRNLLMSLVASSSVDATCSFLLSIYRCFLKACFLVINILLTPFASCKSTTSWSRIWQRILLTTLTLLSSLLIFRTSSDSKNPLTVQRHPQRQLPSTLPLRNRSENYSHLLYCQILLEICCKNTPPYSSWYSNAFIHRVYDFMQEQIGFIARPIDKSLVAIV